MTRSGNLFGAAAALVVLALLSPAPPAAAQGTFAAAQGTDLWGGPGAKGTGNQGARFDTTVTVSALANATGTIDFYVAGAVAATVPFTIPGRGVAQVSAPAALDGMGAFLYRVRSDSSVSAWSETYNDTPGGRFGLSISTFTASDFLGAGDEASGGGADASTQASAGRARTNVGVLCNPLSSKSCRIEVAAFDAGVLLGTGTVDAIPGSAAQKSLADLAPAAAGHSGLAIRVRVQSGSAQPYAIKNDNQTSDGSQIPLSVTRGAFSTAPIIKAYSIAPLTGCSPQTVTVTWETSGAVRVTITGVAGDLPPTGSTSATIVASADVVLTAYADSGETSSMTRRVNVLPPTDPPTPTPDSATVVYGGVITGVLPVSVAAVTSAFTQQQSTGSSFTVSGSTFTYVGGTTAGTDIVTITTQGTCGPASATFTATVVAPGSPIITSFYSDPATSCQLNNNIVLSWTTANAVRVDLTGYPFSLPANGSQGFSYPPTDTSTSKTYTLTAYGAAPGQKATKTITVPVDPTLEYPVVTPNQADVKAGTSITLNITGVTHAAYLNWYIYAMPSGGYFVCNLGAFTCTYQAGPQPGVTDIVRITYHNGCGATFDTFKANVTP